MRDAKLDVGCWVLDVEFPAPFQLSGFIPHPCSSFLLFSFRVFRVFRGLSPSQNSVASCEQTCPNTCRQKDGGQKNREESHFPVPHFSVGSSCPVAAPPHCVSAVQPASLNRPIPGSRCGIRARMGHHTISLSYLLLTPIWLGLIYTQAGLRFGRKRGGHRPWR